MKINKRKKVLFGILFAAAFCLVLPLNAKAQDNDIEEEIREQILREYENNKEFARMQAYSSEVADAYIDELVADRMNQMNAAAPMSTDTYGKIAYCTVPVKTQTTTSNCSAATLLQTMYGLGKQNSISGSTDAQKMATLYNRYDNASAPGARRENGTGSLYVYEIALYLNGFVSSYKYAYVEGRTLSQSDFQNKIWNSLVYNRPVLLHAITSPLSYYGGAKYYHYLSLDTYNRETYKVTIKDCHYDSRYGGTHTQVPVSEAYQAVYNESDRYLIYGQ